MDKDLKRAAWSIANMPANWDLVVTLSDGTVYNDTGHPTVMSCFEAITVHFPLDVVERIVKTEVMPHTGLRR